GGQLPTVFKTHFTEVGQCIDAGYVADLSDVLQERGYDGMFNSKVLDVVSRDGQIYAFPTEAYMLGMAYNTELFEAAGLMETDGTPKQPETWDDVVEFAVKIKEATGKPGFIFPSSSNYGGWLFTNLAWSFGTEFMKQEEDGSWKATFNSEECAAALQWVKDLKWKYDVLPSNTLIDGSEYYKLFSTGNGAMLIAAGDCPKRVTQYDMKPDQLGMFAIPAGPARHVSLLGGTLNSVSGTSTDKQKEAAVRWIETSTSFKATDAYKDTTERDIQRKLNENQLIGIKSMSVWSEEAESVQYMNELIDKYANSNPNHVRLYNEFVNSDVEIQAEEPMCSQELYGILDGCIQEVLINKNADCAALLDKACQDFQTNYLNNISF
ncbi:MAG: ABC transporter substrate-binding protein, partial [Candidatus Ornithomonoglobus sp.]